MNKDFRYEEYLSSTVVKYRAALTQLRISVHCLKMERKSYLYPKIGTCVIRNLRLCRNIVMTLISWKWWNLESMFLTNAHFSKNQLFACLPIHIWLLSSWGWEHENNEQLFPSQNFAPKFLHTERPSVIVSLATLTRILDYILTHNTVCNATLTQYVVFL